MEYSDTIKSLITEESVTLYWDKPETFPKQGYYKIILAGKPVGNTKKTHYTIDGLEADTAYEVEIQLLEKDGTGRDTGVHSEKIELRTGKKKARIDITRSPYFASGDGKTMNTAAIQRAIDDCGPGEAVYIPAGIFLTGALRLHSDMELYIEQGGILKGTVRVEDYLPKIKSRFEGLEMECYSSLLNLGELDHDGGYGCRNVVIRGRGTIAGGGKTLAESVIAYEKERLKDYIASVGIRLKEYEKEDTIPGRARPRLINISNCQDVVISGISIENGPGWNVHMIYSDRITTHGCVFRSEGVWNGDGWDPDSSTNCTIFDCSFYTGDDAIAVKSGKNPEGNVIGRPSAHIRIFDCRSAFGHGITIGSEMSGGIDDVSIWDCDMSRSMWGIEIKGTKKRGGYVRNVRVCDCTAARILFHSVAYNDDGDGAKTPPVFEQCRFERVHVLGEYLDDDRRWIPCEAIELCGFEAGGHELRDITFRDLCLGSGRNHGKQVLTLQYCDNITFERIHTVLVSEQEAAETI